jgi:hypothetical protein
MLSNDPLDFFYAAHNQMASTVMNMTISLTGTPFRLCPLCPADSPGPIYGFPDG